MSSYIKLNDGSIWPNPNDLDIEWKLRNGSPTKGDILLAASYVNAYQMLFSMIQKDVICTIKEIKKESGGY